MAKLVTIAASFAAFAVAAPPDLTGSGHILVLNSTESLEYQATLEDKIGCINDAGQLTVDDCAVFTTLRTAPQSSAGLCDFSDTSQPENVNSKYGRGTYGFSCWEGAKPLVFYSIVCLINYDALGIGQFLTSGVGRLPVPVHLQQELELFLRHPQGTGRGRATNHLGVLSRSTAG